ncbi:hypothetical protein FB45DRAFT_1048098 [Roridomyces roridus]|uniref:Uncharacterized protein n=1 Tax=Roridomyces roridus TaxID=1738132 RepID=A0AAD7AX69_9AGAR|nr:hypothetical protein FB45DRAFT_1048098 [Roridomyces roridus]
MPSPLGDIWPPFHRSTDKPNGSHHRATHWQCINTFRPANAAIDVDTVEDLSLMENEAWFDQGCNCRGKISVTRRIREDQYATGLRQKREPRKNHSEVQVKELLTVPRYADANLSDTDGEDGENERDSVLVSSPAAWRKQVAIWQRDMQEEDTESDSETTTTQPPRRPRTTWLPIKLNKLFGGSIPEPIPRPPRQEISEEALYMELLAAEHSGEEPDDGELEGSGDDYVG